MMQTLDDTAGRGSTPRPATHVAVGLLLVAIGLGLLGGQLGWWPLYAVGRWWPALVIAFGLAQIAEGRNGYMLVAVGALFLMQTLGVMTIRQSWPLLLVAWGLALLFRPTRRGRRWQHD